MFVREAYLLAGPTASGKSAIAATPLVLHDRYPVWSRTAALAIGYREGDDREKVFVRTCQLAKRQDTWFRHQATPIYVAPTVEAVRECWRAHGPWPVCFGGEANR